MRNAGLTSGPMASAGPVVRSVAVSPEGTFLTAACDDGLVRIWDLLIGRRRAVRRRRLLLQVGGAARVHGRQSDGLDLDHHGPADAAPPQFQELKGARGVLMSRQAGREGLAGRLPRPGFRRGRDVTPGGPGGRAGRAARAGRAGRLRQRRPAVVVNLEISPQRRP